MSAARETQAEREVNGDPGRQSHAFVSAAPLIAADVGGTHARVALVVRDADGTAAFSIAHYRKYVCAEFPSLAAIIDDFRDGVAEAPVDRVALAIAGYVVDDSVINISLPWPVSVSALRSALDVRDFAIVNDFEAAAHGVGHVGPAGATLLSGPAQAADDGPVLVVGPGTGLGAAVRIRHPHGPIVLATEAGQATLAPDSEIEFEVLRELRKRGARVLIEDVLSGTGLVNLHEVIRRLRGAPPLALTPAQVTAAALAGTDACAAETIELFCAWFGGVLGDFALLYGATGGIYLAGGVLPQMKELLSRSRFVERFLDKGALREVLARTPVRLIDHAQLGVIGAASWYFERAAQAVPTAVPA